MTIHSLCLPGIRGGHHIIILFYVVPGNLAFCDKIQQYKYKSTLIPLRQC